MALAMGWVHRNAALAPKCKPRAQHPTVTQKDHPLVNVRACVQAEGGMGDIAQLDNLLRALGFSQTKADAEVMGQPSTVWQERLK